MTALLPPHRRALRASQGRLVGGVAGGIAEHLGLPPLVLRLSFLALAFAGGVGIVLYAAFWLLLPQSAAPGTTGPGAPDDRHRGQLVALAAVGAGGVLLLDTAGLLSPSLVPLVLAAAGAALVWQQADEAQRARWRHPGTRGRQLSLVLGGASLLLVGLVGYLAAVGALGDARASLLPTAVAVTGLAVLTAPWWLRLSADLRAERYERIRSQERAEVAAHVHDSVLQTLAMIRKAADDPREVTRLARTQERELRGWLYEPVPSAEARLSSALEQAAAEVELAHGVTVETVVVGDCPTTPSLLAVVAATREALTNAARHSGETTVALYAEVTPDRVEVFVRDRGRGFDPAEVPADRFGVAQSIVGRLERHGGTATVRSRPGGGTEVHLHSRAEART